MSNLHPVPNSDGALFRSNLNSALDYIFRFFSSDDEPDSPQAYEPWVDTSGTTAILKIRDSANTAWVIQGDVTKYLMGVKTPAAFKEGLVLSNNTTDLTNDIDVSPGFCMLSLTSANRRVSELTATLTKRLDADWVAGNNQGGRASGVSLANGTYHVFLIEEDDPTDPALPVVDVLFDSSVTASNRPVGYSARRIGSIIRESGVIRRFIQYGHYFHWDSVARDLNNVALAQPYPVTGNYTMTVPTGMRVLWRGIVIPGQTPANNQLAITVQSPDQSVVLAPVDNPVVTSFAGMCGAASPAGNPNSALFDGLVPTNTSGQLLMTVAGTYVVGQTSSVQTFGYFDFELLEGN